MVVSRSTEPILEIILTIESYPKKVTYPIGTDSAPRYNWLIFINITIVGFDLSNLLN